MNLLIPLSFHSSPQLELTFLANYLSIIENLKKLIVSKGRKPYLLALGKPNPAKLGNFLEIDVFCLVACPENSLLDNREFMKPIVTPYELLLALDSKSIWDPLSYQLNLEVISPKLLDQLQNQNESLKSNDDESDEEPHFSLVSGGYAINKRFVTKSKQLGNTESVISGTALISKEPGVVSKNIVVSAGAEFWRNRTFKGLNLEENTDQNFSKLELGRKGIAKNYSNEYEI